MKRTRIVATILVACLGLCALALVMAGCGQATTSALSTSQASMGSSSASSSVASDELAIPVIGSGDTTIQVKNETGYDIIGIRIKPSSQAKYSAENSFDGFNFSNGSSVSLSFTRAQSTSSYDVLLLTSEDSKIAVRDINLIDTKDMVFHFDEGVGYISYTDADTGESVDNRMQALDAEDDADITASDLETQKG